MEPKEEKLDSKLTPKKCGRCDTINKATSNFCNTCGGPLNIESAYRMKERLKKIDNREDEFWDDPEVREFFKRKMRGKGL